MEVAPGASMMVKGRSTTALCLSVISFLFTPAIARQQQVIATSPSASRSSFSRTALTCDRGAIDPQSYELATIGQARALLTDRSDFWDAFRINRHIATLRELNLDTQELAERALARDPRNMMAHSILARQYTVLGSDPRGHRCLESRGQ